MKGAIVVDTWSARVVSLQTGAVIGRRELDSAEVAAAHLMVLLTMHGWKGDREATARRLADGTPEDFKGMSYRVVPPSVVSAFKDELNKLGDSES
jgi:hypothetical protein